MRYPSLKTLMSAFPHLDRDAARRLRGVLDGGVKTRTFKSVRDTEEGGAHPTPYYMRQLTAINELLEGRGVEVVRGIGPNGHDDGFSEDKILAEYINTGDTYNATIIFSFIHTTDFHCTTLGDFVEVAERRGYRIGD